MKKLSLLVALFCCACSSDSTDDEPCEGVVNPVTGVCQSVNQNNGNNANNANTVNNQNNANNVNNANNSSNLNNSDQNNVVRDMGTEPDQKTAPDLPVSGDMIRFVAIGDQGEGNTEQYQVGQSIGTVCTALGGCDFGLLLGDNFYDSGVEDVNDQMFMTHFAMPYGHLPFPFYVVLGNHDLGGDGLGIDLDFNKANYQIDYGALNPKWIMPSRHYAFEMGPACFIALNTTDIFFNRDDDQYTDIPNFLAQANTPWKIAFGHHPYYSNGKHGNAGEYDQVPFIPIANGEHVKDFIEDNICGQVDFYLCGHDHSRQDLMSTCQGTQFIVSGAGAKTTELRGDNPSHFEVELEGFLLMELTETSAKIQFYDLDGNLEHTRSVRR